MDVNQVLNALDREKKLLREFHDISSQQLRLLDNENIDGMQQLLDTRSDLMLELTAIEATIETWINQLRNDSALTPDILRELRSVNDEIVELASEIVDLDSETHCRLDLIKQKAAHELRKRNQGYRALSGYGATLQSRPRMELNG